MTAEVGEQLTSGSWGLNSGLVASTLPGLAISSGAHSKENAGTTLT